MPRLKYFWTFFCGTQRCCKNIDCNCCMFEYSKGLIIYWHKNLLFLLRSSFLLIYPISRKRVSYALWKTKVIRPVTEQLKNSVVMYYKWITCFEVNYPKIYYSVTLIEIVINFSILYTTIHHKSFSLDLFILYLHFIHWYKLLSQTDTIFSKRTTSTFNCTSYHKTIS